MTRINGVPSVTPVEKIIEARIIGSRKQKKDNNKENEDQESQDMGFSEILSEEIEKTKRVLRR
ncbi:MAG: hypothetical protein J5982_02290 [Bacilli bacterium]|nr:hypothetical protein [Bacilli bacterium]